MSYAYTWYLGSKAGKKHDSIGPQKTNIAKINLFKRCVFLVKESVICLYFSKGLSFSMKILTGLLLPFDALGSGDKGHTKVWHLLQVGKI